LTDAALVHLANRERVKAVFTLDRRHFNVYRRADGTAFQLLP
jgi:predicted nucleic acid-binding protein